MKCGFFLRKKPLECVLSVYSNSENAIKPRRFWAVYGTAKDHPTDEDLSVGTPTAVPFQNLDLFRGSLD